jgi:hypothetical protein
MAVELDAEVGIVPRRASKRTRWASGAAPVRLLLDEMLSPVIAQQLCDRGNDAKAMAGHPLHSPTTSALALPVTSVMSTA